METTPADAVRAAVEQALAITDPARRAKTLTKILKLIDDSDIAKIRNGDIIKLRKRPMTLSEISEQVGLSIGRIDQIVKGTVTGRRARKADQE